MLDIRIAKPCGQTWTAMKGDEQVRHCGACRKNVYNIAEMTEKEIEALIRRTEGHFCARIYRRTDGRVLTADCPRGLAAVRRKRTLAVGAAITAFAGVLYAFPVMGQTRTRAVPRHVTEEPPPLTGKIAVPQMEFGQVAVPTPPRNFTMGLISARGHGDIVMGDIAVIPKQTK